VLSSCRISFCRTNQLVSYSISPLYHVAYFIHRFTFSNSLVNVVITLLSKYSPSHTIIVHMIMYTCNLPDDILNLARKRFLQVHVTINETWATKLIEMVKSKWTLNMTPSPRHGGFMKEDVGKGLRGVTWMEWCMRCMEGTRLSIIYRWLEEREGAS